VEVVVNAIQAIEATNRSDGAVFIQIDRSAQNQIDGHLPEITGFTVIDNGEGFTDENREAFDTLYTDRKLVEGGKGFGRFTCLKYFKDVFIDSVYSANGIFKRRKFRMGKNTDIIIDETQSESSATDTRTVVRLISPKAQIPERRAATLARTLVEKLLPYFVAEDRICPKITLQENDGSSSIVLNEYLNDDNTPLITESKAARGEFTLNNPDGSQKFTARVFKIYSPKSNRSQISLVAHRREVTTVSLHTYIPEFSEEFFDLPESMGQKNGRNFIIKVYVFGEYLDEHVSLERGGFNFNRDIDLLYGISQKDIEQQASEFARCSVDSDVAERRERKIERIRNYVRDEAPWHSTIIEEVDFTAFPYNPTDDQIDSLLHSHKYNQEVKVRSEVKALLANEKPDELVEMASDIVSRISGSGRNELAHYVALRKSVLDLFEKSLSIGSDGKYQSEGVVHDIIFPRKGDGDTTPFSDHNLWIVDERLNFTEYLASDLPIDGPLTDRPDLLAFDKRIGFRGDNEPSNPVTIFELKKPQRDDFVNPSSKEDPVEQIIRYAIKIRDGEYRTPRGREILVSSNTPFYGYVVCELNKKVKTWLEDIKDFKPMPDRLGYFHWHEKLNLYIEVLSWEKILRDATMRNKVFFHKLGID
jgi:hypothetical protein